MKPLSNKPLVVQSVLEKDDITGGAGKEEETAGFPVTKKKGVNLELLYEIKMTQMLKMSPAEIALRLPLQAWRVITHSVDTLVIL